MKKKTHSSTTGAELRRRAEQRWQEQPAKMAAPQNPADIQRQLHELAVHQIELELQNEELVDARARLEALLEKYTDLYDFAPVGYLTLDGASVISEANLAGAGLLGLTRAALINQRFVLFVAPADRPVFKAFLQRVFERGGNEECDVKLGLKDQAPMDVRLRAIIFEAGKACRVAVVDITHHKQAEAERLILNKLESTGILAGGLAHDFNNLLAAILLNVELAQTLTPPDEMLAKLLAEARLATLTASGLTRQLITIASGGALKRKPTQLAELIQESVRLALSGSNVRGDLSLADELWPAAVDEDQIGQVIRNVVLNAREAMPLGGVVTIRAENAVLNAHEQSALPAGEYVRVSITDQGAGMAREVLAKIFDPYFSTKQRGDRKGLGLGLTICHAVIKQHEGAMAVASTAWVGTTVVIHLPAFRWVLGNEPPAPPPARLRPGRILVMDDDDTVRKGVGVMLQRLGQAAELVADGQQAIAVYQQAQVQGRPFDAVILDLTIRNGMGGQAAMQALLALDPNVQALVMSGYVDDPVVMEPERHGFKGVLGKPFDGVKLQACLAQILVHPTAP